MNELNIQRLLQQLDRRFLLPTLAPLMAGVAGLLVIVFGAPLLSAVVALQAGFSALTHGLLVVKDFADQSFISLFSFLGLSTIILLLARDFAQRLSRALTVTKLGDGDYGYLTQESERCRVGLVGLRALTFVYGVTFGIWVALTVLEHGDFDIGNMHGGTLALTLVAGAIGFLAQWAPGVFRGMSELATTTELQAAVLGPKGGSWFSGAATDAAAVELPRLLHTVLSQRIPRLLPPAPVGE